MAQGNERGSGGAYRGYRACGLGMDAVSDVYYFGCWSVPGHYLHMPSGRTSYRDPEGFPCRSTALDSGFLPVGDSQEEGVATLCHLNGWTILAFWDRSVDSRPGANSAFVIRGEWSFGEARDKAKAAFPSIWQRFKFEVKLREVNP